MAPHGSYLADHLTYPDPEQFAVPGPYRSDLAIKYLEQNGTLPGPDLSLELLKQYWDTIPRGGGSEQPSGSSSDHKLLQVVQPQPPMAKQPQARDPIKSDGALRFAERRLDLVPFLGLSPAEIHGGPLSVRQTSPQRFDASSGMTSSPMGSEPAADVATTRPTKTSGSKDLWLPGEIELVIQLRDIQRKAWPDIREILGRHTDLSITDKYYSEKRKAKSRK